MNRDDKFFYYLSKKAKFYNLKISSFFGKHKSSDIRLEKVIKKSKYLKILISVKSKRLKLEIKEQNIYNILALITVLNELNVEINKINQNLKHLSYLKEEEKIQYLKI